MSNLVEIGTPAVDTYGTAGFVAEISEASAGSFTIGAGGLERNNAEYLICWDSGRTSRLPSSIAQSFIDRAANSNLPKVVDVAERRARIEQAEAASRAKAQEEHRAAVEEANAFRVEARQRCPEWAQAVIVAELSEDQSDTMSDYYGSATRRTVILGFSKHKRDLFPELRKFAATFSETAALADAPASAEHREKYSMGAGFYLKNGFRHSTGWQVRKHTLYSGADSVPVGEWHLVDDRAETPTTVNAATPDGIRIEEHTHTKKGFQMFLAILPDRVDRETFETLRDKAQSLGGWYSRPWGKTPGGFAFKDRGSAETFAGGAGEAAAPSVRAEAAPARPAIAEKLREMADKLQTDIDGKFADRRTNTPKQQRQAAESRIDGWHLTRTQQAMRALADAHDAGTLPPVLARVTTKAAISELMRSHIDRSSAGYYDAGIDTNKPANDTPAAQALWAMIGGKSEADKAAEELRAKVDALKFAKIAGYFPTPADVVAEMIDAADMPDGACLVLEPSAGSGAILDGLAEHAPHATAEAFEIRHTLREVLALKGANVIGDDFTEAEPSARFDRVLMNPPFEKGQDMEHVRHAFEFLKPGGRLVAIMSPGPFFRSERKAEAFRDWFEYLGAERRDLPAGAFKDSGTSVATVLVIIDKPGAL